MDLGDICVNHALSQSNSSRHPECIAALTHVETKSTSYLWDVLRDYLKKPTEDSGIEIKYIGNIRNHFTCVCSFVKDLKRYVWYYNPWGFIGDLKSNLTSSRGAKTGMEKIFAQDVENMTAYVKGINENPSDILTSSYGWEEEGEKERYCANAKRLEFIMENLPVGERRDIEEKIKVWSHLDKVPLGERNKIKSVFPGWTPYGPEKDHPMLVLYTAKLLTKADHLEVIHPQNSMVLEGAQRKYNDGFQPETKQCLKDMKLFNVGACVIWTILYMRRADSIISDLLRSRRSISGILDTIKGRLAHDHLDGGSTHKSARMALAKYMDSVEYNDDFKRILHAFYTLIPIHGEYPVSSRSSKRKSVPGKITTEWHREVFGNFNKAMKKVNEIDSGFYSTEYISFGYVEVFNAVALRDGIVSPEDSETIRKVTVDVENSKLHTFEHVESFVTMATMIIFCKHQEEASQGVEYSSTRGIEYPSLTRANRRRTSEYLHDHASEYGYGYEGENNFKKRKYNK